MKEATVRALADAMGTKVFAAEDTTSKGVPTMSALRAQLPDLDFTADERDAAWEVHSKAMAEEEERGAKLRDEEARRSEDARAAAEAGAERDAKAAAEKAQAAEGGPTVPTETKDQAARKERPEDELTHDRRLREDQILAKDHDANAPATPEAAEERLRRTAENSEELARREGVWEGGRDAVARDIAAAEERARQLEEDGVVLNGRVAEPRGPGAYVAQPGVVPGQGDAAAREEAPRKVTIKPTRLQNTTQEVWVNGRKEATLRLNQEIELSPEAMDVVRHGDVGYEEVSK